MTSFRKIAVFWFCLVLFFAASSILAQTQTGTPQATGMSKPRLEGLKEFHEVLRPIWHKAFSEKDYQAIREAVPAFKEKMEVIKKAKLPGFYREKKEDFEKKREALARAVLGLEEQSKGTDDEVLLKATENLHTAYEQLVRVFAPRVRELESFHMVLYPLWHEALPSKDFKAIMASSPALQDKMDALMKVELQEADRAVTPHFVEKRKALKASVNELIKACNKKNNEMIEDRLRKMHAAYQELDRVFEAE